MNDMVESLGHIARQGSFQELSKNHQPFPTTRRPDAERRRRDGGYLARGSP